METLISNVAIALVGKGPHSLGTLIEWKRLVGLARLIDEDPDGCPHSLGTLIEWKPV